MTKNSFSTKACVAVVLIIACIMIKQWPQESTKARTTELAGMAMTMPYRVVIGQPLNEEQQRQVQKIIDNTFDEIDITFNQFNPHSEVSKLNHLRAGEVVVLSTPMYQFLQLVDRFVTMTEGRFDPTIEPLKKLWMPYLVKGTTPPPERIAAIEPAIGWHQVHLENGSFSKDHESVQLNLDAVAKGFAVDLLAYNISQAGFGSLFVEWGGEVKAGGQHPEGRPWRIFISGLESTNPDDALAVVDLVDSALATSGDYYQHWTVETPSGSITYCHVFDPKAKKPLEVKAGSVASASVMTSSCAAADALATALMVFASTDEAQTWATAMHERYPSLTFWLTSR